MSEQIPPLSHDMPPMDAESPFYNQMLGEQRAAEEKQQAELEAAERTEAEELGLPYMSPAERSHLETVANAQSVGDLPEGVSDEDRRRATRGFHTSHREADAAFDEVRSGAQAQLEEFGTRRATAEQGLMEGERKYAGDQVFATVANGGHESVDARVEAEMAKHDKIKGNARVMLENNLRSQYEEEARQAADAAADAREAHINSRGGIGRLNTIDREDREAAAEAKRNAEQLAMEEEAHAENDRRNAEAKAEREAQEARTKEWQERMGTGRAASPSGETNVVDNRDNPVERPDGVDFKTWYNAGSAERQRLVDAAARRAEQGGNTDDDLMKIADALGVTAEGDADHPARGNARVPIRETFPSPWSSADDELGGFTRRLDDPEEAASARRRADQGGYTRRDTGDRPAFPAPVRRGDRRPMPEPAFGGEREAGVEAGQERVSRRRKFARFVVGLVAQIPDAWRGVADEAGRTPIQRGRAFLGKKALELLRIGAANDTGEGRAERMDEADAVDAGFPDAASMRAAAEELRRRPEPARPTPAQVEAPRRGRDRRDDEIAAGLDE
jgi:hypothetical protein